MGLTYFSAFSGIGVAELAMQQVFPDAVSVGFSEIDKKALTVYKRHFPNHVNYGDISKIDFSIIPHFEIFVFGSPCTDISSFNFKQLGWSGTKSSLFFEALKLIQHCKPMYILMENVASMKENIKNDITNALGFEPVFINSSLFGAGHRRRLYWGNFPISPPEINIKDTPTIESILDQTIVTTKPLKLSFKGIPLTEHLPMTPTTKPYNISHHNHLYYLPRKDSKCNPVLTTQSLLNVLWDGNNLRYMTCIELERLQTLPDNYTKFGINDKSEEYTLCKTARNKLIGNSFHLQTFVYLLQQLKKCMTQLD